MQIFIRILLLFANTLKIKLSFEKLNIGLEIKFLFQKIVAVLGIIKNL